MNESYKFCLCLMSGSICALAALWTKRMFQSKKPMFPPQTVPFYALINWGSLQK